MNIRQALQGRRRKWLLLLAMLSAFTLVRLCIQALSDDPEIALIIGEPWEDMRKRSTADIDAAIPGHYWGHLPETDARLRLVDPQYGFTTPLAKFLAISFDSEYVGSIRMSPQVEPLLLDDALKVVLDLQNQWRHSGWIPIRRVSAAPFVDTPEWRAQVRDLKKNGKTTYWQAGDKYQVMLSVDRFYDRRHPDEERYLIDLDIAKPWLPRHVE